MKTNNGYVYLVGAGPGDPGLITLKGIECIKKADVIVYDRLVNPILLKYVKKDVELVYVGKSPDRHTLKQEEITKVLVNKALENKVVTRLKGGDPFVFGRGGEEALELSANNIPFEIVPGITSAVSVPAYAGIPVTHRGLTSNVAFITGNEDPTKDDTDIKWDKISTGIGTLVFLMGMSNLPKIVNKLIENGRSPDTPVALIRWGTLPEQETLVGNLRNIVSLAQQHNFKNPAIIIVGEVVSLRKQLKWVEKKPLWGKRILVTRSRDQASIFSEKIRALGGEPIEFPTIKIVPPDDYLLFDNAIKTIDTYDWIIFTSINGVKSFCTCIFS
jgi:uroporphyrinogen III methyltransferase/synthase